MTSVNSASLRQAKAEWLRVQSDFAALKRLFWGRRWIESLEHEEKYRPDQPRVPAGNSDGGQWTSEGGGGSNALVGGDGNDRIAQADLKYDVNLLDEEIKGGHAVRDHVAKSDAELLAIVERSVLRTPSHTYFKKAQGSYLSIESATDFTNRVLEENMAAVDLVATGATEDAWLDKRFGYPTGKEAFSPGPGMAPNMRPTYSVGVYIVHDTRPGKGYRVHTSYPHNEYPE